MLAFMKLCPKCKEPHYGLIESTAEMVVACPDSYCGPREITLPDLILNVGEVPVEIGCLSQCVQALSMIAHPTPGARKALKESYEVLKNWVADAERKCQCEDGKSFERFDHFAKSTKS